MTSAPSEDSDQSAHLHSLIRICVVRSIGNQELDASSCGQRSDHTGWMLWLIWVFAGHTVLLFALTHVICLAARHRFSYRFTVCIWDTYAEGINKLSQSQFNSRVIVYIHSNSQYMYWVIEIYLWRWMTQLNYLSVCIVSCTCNKAMHLNSGTDKKGIWWLLKDTFCRVLIFVSS